MKTKSNPTVSHQLELVGVVSWTWVGLGFDNCGGICIMDRDLTTLVTSLVSTPVHISAREFSNPAREFTQLSPDIAWPYP